MTNTKLGGHNRAELFAFLVVLAFALLTSGSAAAATKELQIGALAGLSTPAGVEVQRWLNLFAKICNEKGGWQVGGEKYLVKPTVYDCGYHDVPKTRVAAERAVLQDGVKFIVATWGDEAEESVTITEQSHALWMGVSFTNDTVLPKLKFAVRGSGLFFGLGLPFNIQRDMKAKGAKTDLIVNPDSQMGKIGTGLWSGSAKVAGLQVVEPVFFNENTTDYGPLATKIKYANPDFVDLVYLRDDQIVNIVGALKDAGYKGRVFPSNITQPLLDDIVKKVGKEFVEGWECIYYDCKGFEKDPEMVALMDRYVKEYNGWRTEGLHWIGSWFLFKDAVEKTQSVDLDTIVKYLRHSKNAVKTLGGYSQLFARPDLQNYETIDCAIGSDAVGTIKDGKIVPLRSIAVKDHYLASIKAMGLVDVYEKYWAQYGKPVFPPQPSLIDFADMKK